MLLNMGSESNRDQNVFHHILESYWWAAGRLPTIESDGGRMFYFEEGKEINPEGKVVIANAVSFYGLTGTITP